MKITGQVLTSNAYIIVEDESLEIQRPFQIAARRGTDVTVRLGREVLGSQGSPL